MFRSLSTNISGSFEKLSVKAPQADIHSIHVCRNSSASGKTIRQSGIAGKHGLSLLALSRKGEVVTNPAEDFVLEENDLLFLMGNAASIKKVIGFFKDADEEGAIDCGND